MSVKQTVASMRRGSARAARAGDEFLDLPEDRVSVTDEEEAAPTSELDEPCSVDVVRKVSAERDGHRLTAVVVHHERRRPNGRQQGPNVGQHRQ